jgi:outer membrane murein-binding lipoprotein Lpp
VGNARQADAGGGVKKRFSAQRKMDAVSRLLKGESLETLSRELVVTAANLSSWRDTFLAGGASALKSRESDSRDVEISKLRAKVGELTMDSELLNEKIERMEADRPFVWRRSKR